MPHGFQVLVPCHTQKFVQAKHRRCCHPAGCRVIDFLRSLVPKSRIALPFALQHKLPATAGQATKNRKREMV